MPSKPILQMVRQVDRGACMRVRRCPKVAIPRPNPAPGSPTSLRPEPEQRLLPLLRNECPRLVERIKILRTVASAEKQAADIADPLATIETAAGQVKKSALFRCVLSVVLKWGNFVNHGVTDEDGCLRTRGFTFGQFGDRAVEFKATINSSFTSLHYLVVNMLAVAPELELWKLEEEMSAVAPASRVSTENVNALLVAFSDDIKIVTKELDVHSESYKRYGGFEELQRIHGRLRDLELDANVCMRETRLNDAAGQTRARSGRRNLNGAFLWRRNAGCQGRRRRNRRLLQNSQRICGPFYRSLQQREREAGKICSTHGAPRGTDIAGIRNVLAQCQEPSADRRGDCAFHSSARVASWRRHVGLFRCFPSQSGSAEVPHPRGAAPRHSHSSPKRRALPHQIPFASAEKFGRESFTSSSASADFGFTSSTAIRL
eukprot:Polyplicarium_translucidae@DN2826_c0_g1_i4.p1